MKPKPNKVQIHNENLLLTNIRKYYIRYEEDKFRDNRKYQVKEF